MGNLRSGPGNERQNGSMIRKAQRTQANRTTGTRARKSETGAGPRNSRFVEAGVVAAAAGAEKLPRQRLHPRKKNRFLTKIQVRRQSRKRRRLYQSRSLRRRQWKNRYSRSRLLSSGQFTVVCPLDRPPVGPIGCLRLSASCCERVRRSWSK